MQRAELHWQNVAVLKSPLLYMLNKILIKYLKSKQITNCLDMNDNEMPVYLELVEHCLSCVLWENIVL